MTGPTAEDVARDLDADLKACDGASPGPWFAWCLASVSACSVGERYGGLQGPKRVAVGRELLFAPEDAAFIAGAREGWPAAVRRAKAAEAMLRRLVEANDRLEEDDDFTIEAYDEETWRIAEEARSLLSKGAGS